MEFVNRLTGKALEDKVGQYSEVYGEVLLGMHRDIQSQKKLVYDYQQEVASLIKKARQINEGFEKSKHELVDKIVLLEEKMDREQQELLNRIVSLEQRMTLLSICGVALLVICIGLGVFVWMVN